jgi:hypothetical protein
MLFLWFVLCVQSTPSRGPLVTCDNVHELRFLSGEPFAHGEAKRVFRATFRDAPVVVAQPNVQQHDKSRDSDPLAYFLHERARLQSFVDRGCGDLVTTHLGGCLAPGEPPVAVYELLRGFIDAALDMRTTWPQRLKMAIGSVDLLRLMDGAVYADLFAGQLCVNRDLTVKLVDMESFIPFAQGRLGSNQSCSANADCELLFWRHWQALRGLRRLQLDDFECGDDRFCNGVDSASVLAAMCHVVIEPLFLVAREHMPRALLAAVLGVLDRCVTRQRSDRAPPDDIRRAFEALLPAEPIPQLELENSHAGFQIRKEMFDAVRRDAALRYAFVRQKPHFGH